MYAGGSEHIWGPISNPDLRNLLGHSEGPRDGWVEVTPRDGSSAIDQHRQDLPRQHRGLSTSPRPRRASGESPRRCRLGPRW